MNFTLSDRQVYWRDRVIGFMQEYVYPAVPIFDAEMKTFGAAGVSSDAAPNCLESSQEFT
jgi:hypothetical protein